MSKLSIFLVDDDTLHLEMLSDFLIDNLNADIQSFTSGEECLEHLDQEPDIVVLDYNLDYKNKNAKNGIQMLQSIKNVLPNTKVIILSGQDKLEVAVDVMKYGAYDYVVKNESGFIRTHNSILNISRQHNIENIIYTILDDLKKYFSANTPLNHIYEKTAKAITVHMEMSKSLILAPVGMGYKIICSSGYSEEQVELIKSNKINIPKKYNSTGSYILLNSNIIPDNFSEKIQSSFEMTNFVGVPVIADDETVAFILASRYQENDIYSAPIDKRDADTLSAIAGLLSTLIQNKKMMDLKLRVQEEIKEKNQIINIFGQQVSKDVAQSLINSKEETGEKRNVAIMFLDIRNFTPLTANQSPEEVVKYLNSLFDFMIEIIEKHKGIVNQFLGDGFMTTFGAPVAVENPFQNAVGAALEIQDSLNKKIKEGAIPETHIGIGIHGGEAITGNIGSRLRKQYSVTGKVVIVASRIEQLNKIYNSRILISGDIYKNIYLNGHSAVAMGDITLKGISEPVSVYQLA